MVCVFLCLDGYSHKACRFILHFSIKRLPPFSPACFDTTTLFSILSSITLFLPLQAPVAVEPPHSLF